MPTLAHAHMVGGFVLGWLRHAERRDGTMSLVELIDLAQTLIVDLGLRLTIQIPPELAPAFGLAPADAAPVGTGPAPAGEGR